LQENALEPPQKTGMEVALTKAEVESEPETGNNGPQGPKGEAL
jgi:hypothetical protein